MKKSVLQDWVLDLPGLRHQGVILTAVRGCDTAPKHDPSKLFTRCLRAKCLNAFVGDPRKSATFIEEVSLDEEEARFTAFRKNLDHYPHHYVMHVVHVVQIIGYHHSDPDVRMIWTRRYYQLANGLHMKAETKEDLDRRLLADEATFAKIDKE